MLPKSPVGYLVNGCSVSCGQLCQRMPEPWDWNWYGWSEGGRAALPESSSLLHALQCWVREKEGPLQEAEKKGPLTLLFYFHFKVILQVTGCNEGASWSWDLETETCSHHPGWLPRARLQTKQSRQTVVSPVFKVQQERRQKLKFFGKCLLVTRNIPALY